MKCRQYHNVSVHVGLDGAKGNTTEDIWKRKEEEKRSVNLSGCQLNHLQQILKRISKKSV